LLIECDLIEAKKLEGKEETKSSLNNDNIESGSLLVDMAIKAEENM
jgi:hypothetical protein